MFFLGGINSIIPYIIYLSVIWAFMLIGLSGRLNILPHHHGQYAEKNHILMHVGRPGRNTPVLTFDTTDNLLAGEDSPCRSYPTTASEKPISNYVIDPALPGFNHAVCPRGPPCVFLVF
jgi:hypothetical protein